MNKSIPTSPQQYIEVDVEKMKDYFSLSVGLLILFGPFFFTNIGNSNNNKQIFGSYYGVFGLIVIVGLLYFFRKRIIENRKKLLFCILLLLILGIAVFSIYSLTKNINYSKANDSYEGFTNETITTPMIKQKTQELQKALDSLEMIDEETCNILNSIESKFMDNATVPQSDESNLSETTKQSMKNRRIEKAKNDWKTKKLDYEGKTKQYGSVKIMECFEDQKNEEYNEALNELKDLLNSPSISNIDMKLNRMNITNDFSLMYADKFASEASDALSKKEGYQDKQTNNPIELLKQADNIIQKIEQSKTIMNKAKRGSNAINNMTSNPNTIANIITS